MERKNLKKLLRHTKLWETPEKKEKYDNKSKNPFQGTPYEDMFSQMFGSRNGFQQQRRKSAPDKVVRVQITPIESYKG